MTAAARYDQLWRELALADESRLRLRLLRRASLQSQRKLDAVAVDLLRRGGGTHAPAAHRHHGQHRAALRSPTYRRRRRRVGQRRSRPLRAWLVAGIVPDFFGPYRADFQNRRAITHEALLFIKKALSSDGAFSFTGESHQYENVTLA